jgi:hypothetical protein
MPDVKTKRGNTEAKSFRKASLSARICKLLSFSPHRPRYLAARFALAGVLVRLHRGSVIAFRLRADRWRHACRRRSLQASHRRMNGRRLCRVELVPALFVGKSTHGISPSRMRPRRLSDDDKARIIEESLAPGALVSAVARRHGLTAQQLFTWPRGARRIR